jgi:hypothetical protein
MRFIERLAHSAVQRAAGGATPGAARVVLPSRFASRGGDAAWGDDGAAAADAVRAEAVDAGRTADAAMPTPAQHRPPAIGARAQPRQGPGLVRPPPASAASMPLHSRPEAPVEPSFGQARAELSMPRGSKDTSPNAVPAPHAAIATPRRSTPEPRDAASPADTVASPRAVLASADPAQAHTLVPDDRAAARASRAPLREATLARRVSMPRDEPPVIHVTIDRIDVRAPAAPARPAAQRSRAQQQQPSVSLADYLRGRGRSGGTS